jgi:hypothetical protein
MARPWREEGRKERRKEIKEGLSCKKNTNTEKEGGEKKERFRHQHTTLLKVKHDLPLRTRHGEEDNNSTVTRKNEEKCKK